MHYSFSTFIKFPLIHSFNYCNMFMHPPMPYLQIMQTPYTYPLPAACNKRGASEEKRGELPAIKPAIALCFIAVKGLEAFGGNNCTAIVRKQQLPLNVTLPTK